MKPKIEKHIAGCVDLKLNLPVVQNFSNLLTCSKTLWCTCRMVFCSGRRSLSRLHSAAFGIKVHLQNSWWHSVFLAGIGLPFCGFLRNKNQLNPQIKQTLKNPITPNQKTLLNWLSRFIWCYLGNLVFVKSVSGSNVTDSKMNWQILAGCFGGSGCQKPQQSEMITGWMFSAYLDCCFPKLLVWLYLALHGLKNSEQ